MRRPLATGTKPTGKKVHLRTVAGNAYCHVNNHGHYDDGHLLMTDKIAETTCKRCFRKYHSLPITHIVLMEEKTDG